MEISKRGLGRHSDLLTGHECVMSDKYKNGIRDECK